MRGIVKGGLNDISGDNLNGTLGGNGNFSGASTANSVVTSVTGSGWIVGIMNVGTSYITLSIDGTQKIPSSNTSTRIYSTNFCILLLCRFETGFEFKSDTASKVIYLLD